LTPLTAGRLPGLTIVGWGVRKINDEAALLVGCKLSPD
jgi:hypothetical protein